MDHKYSFLIISLLTILFCSLSFSQTYFGKDSINIIEKYNDTIYLVCDAKMDVPELARRIGLKKVSYKAALDIINFRPQNIKISCIDSTEIWFDDFKKATLSNIQQLEFIKDTSDYSLIFNYNFSKTINSDYIDYTEQNIIDIYFRTYDCSIIENLSKRSIEIDTINNSVKLYSSFKTYKILKQKPDILVERIFSDGKDSVIIIKNNLPYFENDINRIANTYTKEFMDKNLLETKSSISPKHYFINFDIVTVPKQCGCK